jgi:hypothetical protein
VTDTLASIEDASTPGAEKRRSSRVQMAIPITVSGVDALGEPFREITTTLSVSCNGCKYKSKNYVQRDSLVTLELAHPNPRLSPRVVRGRARWVQRPRNLRDQYEIGLELIVCGNVWGLNSPPPDWFPHPDDETVATREREVIVEETAEAGAAATPVATHRSTITSLGDFDPSEEVADAGESTRSVSAAVFEEIDISGAIGFTPEEAEPAPAPADLHARLQETIVASLKTMVDRVAQAAAQDVAARIAAALDEARAACGMATEEFEEKIRGALDGALNPEEIEALTDSAEKQARKRARKASRKKGRRADDGEDAGR